MSNIDQLAIVHYDQTVWSGQVILDDGDITLGDGGKMPSKKVVKSGSKLVIDPAHLNPFLKKRTETRRLLMDYGEKFMNGYAVPVSALPEIEEKLSVIITELESLKAEFMINYHEYVSTWISENPDDAAFIRKGILPQGCVEAKFNAEYHVFQVSPTSEQHAESINKKVISIGDDLLSEVIKDADKFYLKNIAGKTEISKTTSKTLRKIRNKLDGLSFLNPSFGVIVKALDEALLCYKRSATKSLCGQDFYQVMACILIVANRQKLLDYSDGTLTVDGYLKDLMPSLESEEVNDDIAGDSRPKLTSKNNAISGKTVLTSRAKIIPAGDLKVHGAGDKSFSSGFDLF